MQSIGIHIPAIEIGKAKHCGKLIVNSSLQSIEILHIADDSSREFAGADLGRACRLALEVVGDELLLDGLLHGRLDQLGGFFPADEVEQHDAGEDDRAGIDDVFVGVLGSGAVRGFKDREAVADVGAGSDAEAADLRRSGVRDVVAVEVGGGQDGVVRRANDDLLEDGVGDAVVDEDLLTSMRRCRGFCRWSRARP
jgi:hypothetical protein